MPYRQGQAINYLSDKGASKSLSVEYRLLLIKSQPDWPHNWHYGGSKGFLPSFAFMI